MFRSFIHIPQHYALNHTHAQPSRTNSTKFTPTAGVLVTLTMISVISLIILIPAIHAQADELDDLIGIRQAPAANADPHAGTSQEPHPSSRQQQTPHASASALQKLEIQSGLNGSGSSASAFSPYSPFSSEASVSDGFITFTLHANEGAYIYKDEIKLESGNALLTPPVLPPGQTHSDFQGTSEVYFDKVSIVTQVLKSRLGDTVTLSFRGCDQAGICYPPEKVSVDLPEISTEVSTFAEIPGQNQPSDIAVPSHEASAPAEVKDSATATAPDSPRSSQSAQPPVSPPSSHSSAPANADTLISNPDTHVPSADAPGASQASSANNLNLPKPADSGISVHHIPSASASSGTADTTSGTTSWLPGEDSFIITLIICFILGAALDLTPCVLPMLPVYASMITGSRDATLPRLLLLNLSYVIGMSAAYALTGLIFAYAGMAAHAVLQHPIAVILTSLLFVLLALDCAGIISLRLPVSLTRMAERGIASGRRGSLSGALLFGILSALLTTPCTGAPLAGALVYVARTGDLIAGSMYFTAIGIGMALPLVFIGLAGGSYIRKGGRLGHTLHRLMALPLLFGAYYVSSHLFNESRIYVVAALIAVSCIYTAFILLPKTASGIVKTGGYASAAALAAVGITLFSTYSNDRAPQTFYEILTSADDLNTPKYCAQPLLVTFSAEWCANCHELDRSIYSNENFKEALGSTRHIRFDLTDPASHESQELTRRFGIIGVPAALLINDSGGIVMRITGRAADEEYLKLARQAAALATAGKKP